MDLFVVGVRVEHDGQDLVAIRDFEQARLTEQTAHTAAPRRGAG
jgi:hypothetical protein